MLEEVFDDLLRFIFPNADELFDLQRGFLFLDKELGQFYPEPEKISRGYSEEKTNAIIAFIYNYVRFAEKKMYCKFEEKIDEITGKTNTMGIIEQIRQMKIDAAREEGREEERAERLKEKMAIVKRLLDLNMDSQNIAGVVGMPISFIKKVRAGKA